jgi:hypothetical protein
MPSHSLLVARFCCVTSSTSWAIGFVVDAGVMSSAWVGDGAEESLLLEEEGEREVHA